MTLMGFLSKQGIEISPDMDATTIIRYVSSLSSLAPVFPNVFSMVNTLQSYVDNYNSAIKALDKAQEVVDNAQGKLVQAKDMYDMILNTPMAYVGAGAGKVAISPLPSLTTYYAAITAAQKFLDQAEKALEKARNKVKSIETQIEKYKKTIVSKLMSIKV